MLLNLLKILGKEVIPILPRYEGVGDCFSTILREEGVRGLFKGFGALILQYSVHFLIIKFSSKIISQIVQVQDYYFIYLIFFLLTFIHLTVFSPWFPHQGERHIFVDKIGLGNPWWHSPNFPVMQCLSSGSNPQD